MVPPERRQEDRHDVKGASRRYALACGHPGHRSGPPNDQRRHPTSRGTGRGGVPTPSSDQGLLDRTSSDREPSADRPRCPGPARSSRLAPRAAALRGSPSRPSRPRAPQRVRHSSHGHTSSEAPVTWLRRCSRAGQHAAQEATGGSSSAMTTRCSTGPPQLMHRSGNDPRAARCCWRLNRRRALTRPPCHQPGRQRARRCRPPATPAQLLPHQARCGDAGRTARRRSGPAARRARPAR